MIDDIQPILDSWPYDPDEDIIVRIIEGGDGKKVQMRVDMGVIQMNLDGPPSGEHPEGYESWFEYYRTLAVEAETDAVDDFYTLDEDDFALLRREGVQYYYRYLSLMKLGDYKRVIRDTERNMRLFEFVKKYASSEMDRWALDQYRPYVIMMNTRAKASLAVKNELYTSPEQEPEEEAVFERALTFIDEGIDKIRDFYKDYGLESEEENSLELAILTTLRSEFNDSLPPTLEDQLRDAIEEERFEDAARLRDKIRIRDREE